jgi:hypothetical protein
VSAAVEPHGYGSPVLEFCKQVFDPVALLVYVLQYIAENFRFALGGIRGKCHAQSGPHDRRRCRNLCRTEARTQPASPVAMLRSFVTGLLPLGQQ